MSMGYIVIKYPCRCSLAEDISQLSVTTQLRCGFAVLGITFKTPVFLWPFREPDQGIALNNLKVFLAAQSEWKELF